MFVQLVGVIEVFDGSAGLKVARCSSKKLATYQALVHLTGGRSALSGEQLSITPIEWSVPNRIKS